MPLQPARDVLSFLRDVADSGWVQAHETARDRLLSTLEFVRSRIARWSQASADFAPRELPRMSFVGGRPATKGRRMLSVTDQIAVSWGTRKATEMAVMTPFVGETESGTARLVQRFIELSRRS
jgi:hypothetical protein